jgi:hypothetical protein
MSRFNVKLVVRKAINTSFFTIAITLFISGFSLTPAALAAELVINGDFENPVVNSPKFWTTYFGQNYTAGIATCPLGDTTCNDGTLIPGWSVVWTDSMHAFPDTPSNWLPGRIELQRDPPDPKDAIAHCPAKKGCQKAELDSHHRLGGLLDDNVTIYQKVKVCPKTPYILTFSWKARLNVLGNSDMELMINGTELTAYTDYHDSWTDVVYPFVSSEKSFTELGFHSCGDGNTLGVFLDEVSLTGPDGSEEEPCPDPDICNYAKPRILTLLYDADVNGRDQHDQVSNEVIVKPAGVPVFPDPAYIKVFGQNKNKGALFTGTYSIGDLIEIEGPRRRIPSRLKFEIWSMEGGGELVQTVQFHTSCSQPLSIGDEFGAIVVWSAVQ